MSNPENPHQITPELRASEQIAPVEETPALAVASSISEPRPNQLFFGDDGLRSGWRLAIYLGLVGLGFVLLGLVQHLMHKWGVHPLQGMLLAQAMLVAAAIFPAAVMGMIEKRRFGKYGLPQQSALGRNFWVGAVWGFVSLSLLLLAMRVDNVFYFGGLALHGTRILKYAIFYAAFFLLVAFFEEFAFRGYAQFTLGKAIGFWPSAFLFSLLFGAVHLHNPGEAWAGALAAGCIAMFFCLTLRRTGSLWWAVGFHAAWDWAESFFYSVLDSGTMVSGHLLNPTFHGPRWLTGGSVGPEGSALVFVVIAVMWLAFSRAYPETKGAEQRWGKPA